MSSITITDCANFDSMIADDMLAHLRSDPKYGVRSYAWAARTHSPIEYATWLRGLVARLLSNCTDEYVIKQLLQEISIIALRPYFFAINGEICYIQRFNGIFWVDAEISDAEKFLRSEIYQFVLSVNPTAARIMRSFNFRKIVKYVFSKDLAIPDNSDGFDDFVTLSGVLKLEDGAYVLKPTAPDDMYFSGSDIIVEEFTYGDPDVQKLLTWLRQIFLDRDVTIEFLNHIRGGLTYNIPEAVWHGIGSNSKSSMQKLVNCVFGEYMVTRFSFGPDECHDIFVTNDTPDKFPDRAEFHFAGRWVDDVNKVDPANGIFLRDPEFYKNIEYLAPAFLWLLTQADILEHI